MTEEDNQLTDLFIACWKDDVLKQRFLDDPRTVLAEHGMSVPDEVDLVVVENTDRIVHITLPAPPGGGIDLSDEELGMAAGGRDGPTTPVSVCDAFVNGPGADAPACIR